MTTERTLLKWRLRHNLYVTLEYKLADLWIGVFWRHHPVQGCLHVWLCLIPCFPLHVWKFHALSRRWWE